MNEKTFTNLFKISKLIDISSLAVPPAHLTFLSRWEVAISQIAVRWPLPVVWTGSNLDLLHLLSCNYSDFTLISQRTVHSVHLTAHWLGKCLDTTLTLRKRWLICSYGSWRIWIVEMFFKYIYFREEFRFCLT